MRAIGMRVRIFFYLSTFCIYSNTYAADDARVAIIIDDIGYNQALSERAARLPGAFTLSVLPFTPFAIETAQLAHRQNKELMLHAPMSNIHNLPLGRGGLYSAMDKDTLIHVLRDDLNSVPFIKGINNHMGSQLTQQTQPMQWLMAEVRSRGLYFVDSRTSAKTVALDIAKSYQVPSLKRDVFLDDADEPTAIDTQVRRLIQLAQEHKYAVAIGHPYPATLAALEHLEPLLAQAKVKLVYVSQLLDINNSLPPLTPPPSDATETSPAMDYCPAPPFFAWTQPSFDISLQQLLSMSALELLNMD